VNGKRILALILVLALSTALMTSCSSGETDAVSDPASPAQSGDASSQPSSSMTEAPREISLCMSQIRWGSSVDEKMMQEWTRVIEENTNTKIEIIAPTHNDYEQKLNVLLAAGDYPDIIRPAQAWDTVPQYAVRGYLQPVTEYLENDPRFANAKTRDLSMYQSGNDIYGIPVGTGSSKILWFRSDLVDKYGLSIKETMTTDEFVTELKKVNQSEAIPFSFPKHIINFQLFYNFFGAYGGILPDENGVYYDGIQTDEMRQALLWVKNLYDEGLMDAEFITNENAAMREKLSAGKAVSDIDYASRYSYYVQTAEEVGAASDFIPVYTLIGPNGHSGNLNESGSETFSFSITNKNIEASLDIVHWLFYTPEGVKHNTLGVEGVHYDITNGVLVPREAAVSSGYAITHSHLSGGLAEVPIESLGFSFQNMPDEMLSNMLEQVSTALSPQYLGPMIKIPMGSSSFYDENIAAYNANLYEMATKIVLGNQSIDDAYADYAKFWNSIKGDKILEDLNS